MLSLLDEMVSVGAVRSVYGECLQQRRFRVVADRVLSCQGFPSARMQMVRITGRRWIKNLGYRNE